MPERGTLSLFELALLASAPRWSSRARRNTCRTSSSRPSCGRARARLEHRRRICRAHLVWARRVLRHRRLYLDDPDGERDDALDRPVDRGRVGGGVRDASHAGLRAPARTVLHPVDAGRRRGRAHRRAQLGKADRGPRPRDPAGARASPTWCSPEDHLCGLDAGISRVVYAVTKAVEGSRYGYYLFAARTTRTPRAPPASIRCWRAPAPWA